MKIKALTTFRDSRGSFRRGMPGDVPDNFGRELVKAKLAARLNDDGSETGAPEPSEVEAEPGATEAETAPEAARSAPARKSSGQK